MGQSWAKSKEVFSRQLGKCGGQGGRVKGNAQKVQRGTSCPGGACMCRDGVVRAKAQLELALEKHVSSKRTASISKGFSSRQASEKCRPAP